MESRWDSQSRAWWAAVGQLPGGGLLNHHGRALLLASIALAALASIGAVRLRAWVRSRPGATADLEALVRRGALLVVALDMLFLAPFSLPLPASDATPVSVADQLEGLSPGPVLDLPSPAPGALSSGRCSINAHTVVRWCVAQPPGPAQRPSEDRCGRWLGGLAFDGGPAAAPPPAVPLEIPGVSVVLVREPYVDRVAAVLGCPMCGVPTARPGTWRRAADRRRQPPAPPRR